MAVSSYWYVNGMKNMITNANTLFGTNTFKVALLNSNLALNAAQLRNNTAFTSISSTQISGTNYTAGGVNLSIPVANVTVNTTSGEVIIGDAIANTSWTSATFSAQYAVIYHVATDYLMGIVDFGTLESCSNGSFTINWDDVAIFKITPATIT